MKNLFLKCVLVSSSMLLVTSCGSDKNSTPVPAQVNSTVNYSENYLSYPSTHTQCDNYLSFNTVDNVTSLTSGEMLTQSYNLSSSYLGYPILKSANNKLIYGSYFDTRIIQTINFVLGENMEIIGASRTEDNKIGKSIVYCGNQTLIRQSAQHIGLNILTTLDKTFESLEIANIADSIKPIAVFSHPIFETKENYIDKETNEVIYERSSVMTDNAFYYNNGLYFIPHSQEHKDALGSAHLNYWEIPFVASHEYGHHIFATFFPTYYETETIRSISHKNCFDTYKINQDYVTSLQGQPQKRVVTTADVTGSFNEGFADLIAFYTLDKAHSSLDNVIGFDDEREVDSLLFADFSKKELGYYEGSYFFSDETLSYKHSYAKFQDTHAIGAIVAAQFENFLASEGLGSIQKLIIVTDWIKKLNKNYEFNKKLTPKEYMKTGIEDFVSSFLLNTGKNTLNTEQIAAITSGFSHLY